ncbi:MAG: phosphate ABC transporter substrate-binding/OmpA family protein [Candidatus Wallbacteria bacterium]|nr:phosphate ABC transporter substrate-binding/OmpA family protein [Candidatus Wallbacteria bacterium]
MNGGDKSAERIGKVVVFLLMITGIAFAGRKYIMPYFDLQLVEKTSSKSQYRREVKIAHDSFAGYAVLRSEDVRKEMAAKGVLLTFIDDAADYTGRIGSLKDGSVDLAVFTIDAYIKSASVTGRGFPGSIVAVIDETAGADAIVSYKDQISTPAGLNHSDVRFVFTPDSPSETLARILKADFELPLLTDNWFVHENGAEAVYNRMKKRPAAREAYVLWEPFVSMALENPDATLLFDSSKVSGYIVDVLIANRKFLIDEQQLICDLLAACFRALHRHHTTETGMAGLISADAAAMKQVLTADQSKIISRKIRWKNTLENYAHFGIFQQKTGLLTLEDMIRNITSVLVQTGAVKSDPAQGNASSLFYDGCLKKLQQEGFHPAKKLGITADDGVAKPETIDEGGSLTELTAEQWALLVPLGELRVEPVAFGRGNAEITVGSRHDLDRLCDKLRTYPGYYLRITGHTRDVGDRDANRSLSEERSRVTAKYLVGKGIPSSRIRASGSEPGTGKAGAGGQSVSFELLQQPY